MERRPTGQYFLAVDLSSIFSNTGTTDETFEESGKDSLRCLVKSSPTMCKKVQAQSSLEPPLECKQDQILFIQGLLSPL